MASYMEGKEGPKEEADHSRLVGGSFIIIIINLFILIGG